MIARLRSRRPSIRWARRRRLSASDLPHPVSEPSRNFSHESRWTLSARGQIDVRQERDTPRRAFRVSVTRHRRRVRMPKRAAPHHATNTKRSSRRLVLRAHASARPIRDRSGNLPRSRRQTGVAIKPSRTVARVGSHRSASRYTQAHERTVAGQPERAILKIRLFRARSPCRAARRDSHLFRVAAPPTTRRAARRDAE